MLKILPLCLLALLMAFGISARVEAAKTSSFEYLELFNKVMFIIENQYYRDVDFGKLVHGAIKGMMETLDPHSDFLDEESFAKIQDETSGEFGGLGIEVSQKDGMIYIVAVIEDTPAFRTGLKSGDRIVEVNHESLVGYAIDDVVKKMKGEVGKKIDLGILREGENKIKYFELVREKIKVTNVKSMLIDKHYAYVRLVQFQKGCGEEVAKQLKRLGATEGIILDLRSNPGGLLDEAVNLSSIFLQEGVVVSTQGRDAKKLDVRQVVPLPYKELTLPVVVLVNGASASASEIVAGALQDHKRAIILGSRTFGKGSVQSVIKIDEKRGMKLTIAQYMTPLNRKIQAIGIVPDIAIGDIDNDLFDKYKRDPVFIREQDLKNHISATIATEDEKQLQQEISEQLKQRRVRQMEQNKSGENHSAREEVVKKFAPEHDYQVIQAVKFLKGMSVYKKMVLK